MVLDYLFILHLYDVLFNACGQVKENAKISKENMRETK